MPEKNKSECGVHCWHAHEGPLFMVVPDGHIVQECCKCQAHRTIHRDHAYSEAAMEG